MRFAIIVCTRNRSALLAECLASVRPELLAAAEPGLLIVVDNGSTDDTESVCRAFGATVPEDRFRYVSEPRTGLSIARNRGIDDGADAEIVAFLDDDAKVAPGWLESCLAAFDAYRDVSGIGGEILPWFTAETMPPPAWFKPPLSHYYCTYSLPGADVSDFPARHHPVGVNMAFRRAVFDRFRFSEALGRSGTNLISGEEAELCGQIRRAGGRLLYVAPMRVEHFIHPDRLNEGWIRERHYYEGISRARLRMSGGELTLILGKNVVRLAVSALRLPFSSGFSRLLAQCEMRRAWGFLTEFLSPSS